MVEFETTPLVVCMENALGEEVELRVEPEDNFQSFLEKAKLLLGYDVDINSITDNQPVSLTDNIYDYLLKSERGIQPNAIELDSPNDPQDDLLYILGDGTQIRASQIQFDNDDPPIDLATEKIPFVKYSDDIEDTEDDKVHNDQNTIKYNIIGSPISRRSNKNGSHNNFVNNLPFKLVCNNTIGFETQFSKYLESTNKTYANLNPVSNSNISPRSLIKDNFKKYDDYKEMCYTREDVLNMLKDSPVNSLPFEYTERKHVRKTDPSRIHKCLKPAVPCVDINGVIIGEGDNQPCYICRKNVNYAGKLYLFDNKDQKLHRTQKKLETQLKVICENCLNEHFRPCRMKNVNEFLESDEFLVIHNNQQFIFKKVNNVNFPADVLPSHVNAVKDHVTMETESNCEIMKKPEENPPDIVVIVEDEKENSSDVEIIEEIDNIIDNLEETDEKVNEFLGIYQCKKLKLEELKCRFCEKVFIDFIEVSDHCDAHKHTCEDGNVFPCPLCDYGFSKLKWLKAHVKAAHDTVTKDESTLEIQKTEDSANIE